MSFPNGSIYGNTPTNIKDIYGQTNAAGNTNPLGWGGPGMRWGSTDPGQNFQYAQQNLPGMPYAQQNAAQALYGTPWSTPGGPMSYGRWNWIGGQGAGQTPQPGQGTPYTPPGQPYTPPPPGNTGQPGNPGQPPVQPPPPAATGGGAGNPTPVTTISELAAQQATNPYQVGASIGGTNFNPTGPVLGPGQGRLRRDGVLVPSLGRRAGLLGQ